MTNHMTETSVVVSFFGMREAGSAEIQVATS